jgi:hypothetical protein
MEAGRDKLCTLDNASEAVMSEARRGFCRPGTKQIDGWRFALLICLGTRSQSWCRMLVGGSCAVAVLRVPNLSCVQKLTRKNRDEFFNFIVRVISRLLFSGLFSIVFTYIHRKSGRNYYQTTKYLYSYFDCFKYSSFVAPRYKL